MTGVVEAWVRRLVAARRGSPPALPVTGHGHRLVGGPVAVTRLLMVPASTVALVLSPGRPVELRMPGEVLVPPFFRAVAAQPVVLVVTLSPVRLEVTVLDAVTFDGHALDEVTVRLTVVLEDREGLPGLRQLAAEHGLGLEAGVLAQVQREVAAAVRGAVRMNRLVDLQRLSLTEVLRGRWWPPTFVDGSLACSAFEVRHVRWPGRGQDEPTIPLPVVTP